MVQECAPNATPNGDGMPNLLEYLADTGPSGEIRNPKSETRRWRGPQQFLELAKGSGFMALDSF
jgi:hypothetical protein